MGMSGNIPEPAGPSIQNREIPEMVAERPQEEVSPETVPYNISFVRYRDDVCQIDEMTPVNAKATLKILRDAGIYFIDAENFTRQADRKVEIKNIENTGDYSILYQGMIDEEIKEIKFIHVNKEVNIRIFFFTLEKERIFYMIGARQDHYDSSKSLYRG